MVHAVTKKQASLEKNHYYFKLGKEKLVDSEAKFKAGASWKACQTVSYKTKYTKPKTVIS